MESKNLIWIFGLILCLLSACHPDGGNLDEVESVTEFTPQIKTEENEIPTLVAEPSPTIGIVPTLSIQESESLLRELLADNRGCELPCWWGVSPGVTTENEAHDLFLSMGMREWSISDNDFRTVSLGYEIPDDPYYNPSVGMRLWIQGDLVKYIHVSATRPKHGLEDKFVTDWQHYSFSKVLGQFGQPAYVRVENISRGSPTYVFGLSYPEIGMEINYLFDAENLGSQHQICPSFDFLKFVNLSFYQIEIEKEVPDYLIVNNLDKYVSWQIATGTGLDSFYSTFSEASNQDCFTLTP